MVLHLGTALRSRKVKLGDLLDWASSVHGERRWRCGHGERRQRSRQRIAVVAVGLVQQITQNRFGKIYVACAV